MDKTNIANSPREERLWETVTIGIDGMTCDNCVRKVERVIRSLPGIKELTVDRVGAFARVTFDRSLVDVPAMHDALLKSGYTPVPATRR